MSFSIKLQKNSSENNAFDKTITDITTMTGTLRNETSIIDPVILCECSMSDVKNANYMTISEFGRKYFITDVKSIRSGIVEIYGHCDVLSTFKTGILSNKAIIERQETEWNLYIDDGVFWKYNNPMVLTESFPSGFANMEFVLSVAGS